MLGSKAQRIDLRVSFSAHSGFGDRLLSEVKKLAPKDVKIRVGACWDQSWVERAFKDLEYYMVQPTLGSAQALQAAQELAPSIH